jgi:hypothetical protein
LNDLQNVSTCDVFMTKEHADRIIISFCLQPNLLGSIVIREQADLESYEVVVDTKQLALLHTKSAQPNLDLSDTILRVIEDWDCNHQQKSRSR